MNKQQIIIDIISKYFDTNILENIDSRKRIYVYPRQMAQYFIYKYTKLSSKKIGIIFNQDHTTVLYNKRRFDEDMQTDSNIKSQYLQVRKLIEKSFVIFSEESLIKKGFKLVEQYGHDEYYTIVYIKGILQVDVTYQNDVIINWDVTITDNSMLTLTFSELIELDSILNKKR